MADYTFESTLAADPFSFQRAANADMAVYDAADEAQTTLLALKDLNGLPIPNPLKTSADGFTPAFIAPVPQVKLVGGGLAVVASSFQGVRDEAVAAKQAAAESKLAAQDAASAAADTVTEALSGAVTDAKAAKAAAVAAASLVGAPADAAVATVVNAPGSATTAALAASYAPPTNAFVDFLGRVRTYVRDVSLMVVSDSTVHGAGTWGRQLPAAFSELFPEHTISARFWNDTATDWDPATVIAGSGSRTIHLWFAAQSGKTWQYFTDVTRREKMLATPAADLIIISNGHNENNTNAQAGNMAGLRAKAITHIEQIRSFAPGAAVVLLSQNPLLSFDVASENRADMYRRIAQQRGYGFVDVCQAFHDDGRPLTDLVSGDGIHPTAEGYTLWLNTVMAHIKATPKSQPIPAREPAFSVVARNAAPNPIFDDFDGVTAPNGWTLVNCTAVKDTANFETGAWAVKFTKTASGSSAYAQADLPLKLVAGQTVTFAARMRAATGQASSVGQLTVLGSTGSEASDIWATNDQYFWRTVTYRVPASSTFARARIMVDPSTAASAQLTVDRVSLVVGEYPADLPSVQQVIMPAGVLMPTDVQAFDANGTWTKPGAGYSRARITLVGGGGGGGSGRRSSSGTAACGGGGGSHGAIVTVELSLADLPSSLAVVVGAGGAGGTSVTADSTNGNNGSNGGLSSVIGGNLSVQASGGFGGAGGTTTGGAGGTAQTASTASAIGGSGSSATGGAGSPANRAVNASGAGGGGVTSAPAFSAGGNGTSAATLGGTLYSAAGGTTDGANGAAAATTLSPLSLTPPAGRSGGAGAGSTAGDGGNGGPGFGYGAGGSGGGGSLNVTGKVSGAGAAGMPGRVVIECYS